MGKRKRAKIDLGMKINMINSYEEGQPLSSIARQFGFSISTVHTIIKDSERIKEHMREFAPLKSTILSKRRTGAIYEMEKLLILWIEGQIKQNIQLSLTSIQEKALSIYAEIKDKHSNAPKAFLASKGWFCRFKQRYRNRVEFQNDKDNEMNPQQLNVDVDENYIDGLIESREEFSEDNSTSINRPNREEEEDEAVEKSWSDSKIATEEDSELKSFPLEEASEAFREIDSAMSRFRNIDPNTTRFLKVFRGVEEALSCYKEIYEKTKEANILSSSSSMDQSQPGPSGNLDIKVEPIGATISSSMDRLITKTDPLEPSSSREMDLSQPGPSTNPKIKVEPKDATILSSSIDLKTDPLEPSSSGEMDLFQPVPLVNVDIKMEPTSPSSSSSSV